MNRRMFWLAIVLAGVVSIPLEGAAQGEAAAGAGPLKVLKTIKIGGSARWDLLEADPGTGLVYISNGARVVVVDVDKGTTVGEVVGTPGVHGIGLVPERNEGYATDGSENMVNVFDLKTLKSVRKIKTGQNPDAITYDPATKKMFVMNGRSNDLTIIDTTAPDKEPVTLDPGGKPELGVSDGTGHVYVNLEDKSEIVQIDSKEGKVLAHWPLAPGEGPTGLAIDVAHHRLFAGCGNSMMVVMDADSGKVIATPAVGQGVDGAAFDPKLGLAIAPNGRDGTITVIKEESPDKFTVVQTLKTSAGSRTIAGDPKSGKIYLPSRISGDGSQAFSLIVIGPAS